MRNIARLSDNDRRELFRNTADKMGLNDAIVEKDFWVCFTLDYLFHRSPWKESITFKGGTSLSKAFHLISRFSEDIDLILDWRVLGYGKDEPWEKRSNTKQDAFNKEANARAEVFLSETFCPAVKAGLSQEIGCEANVYIDEKDKQTVIFAYPHLFTNTATLQVIRLEIGALAAWTPAKTAQIEPYAAKYYPKIFEQKETAILTVAPERTFWEKATILHHEANRPEHLEMPQRYSRHYYDLYRMAATPVKEAAFSRLDLLKKVVDFKMKFYPRSWAKYPEAVPGTLKLLPPEYRFAALEADYNSMQDKLKIQMSAKRQEIEKTRRLIRGLYENFVQGILTNDEYFELKADYEHAINALSGEIEVFEKSMDSLDNQLARYRAMEKDAKTLAQDHVLTAELIERLIERIEIDHERNIHVTFRFKNEFQGKAVELCATM